MLYRWLLFGHILFAVVWVGGGILTQIHGTRALRATDPAKLTSLAQDAAWAGNRIFLPASVLTATFGVLLVLNGGWEFEELWIAVGIVGFLATGFTGSAILGPTSKKLEAAIAEHGPSSDQAQSLARRLIGVARIDMVVLVLVILDMTVKPGA